MSEPKRGRGRPPKLPADKRSKGLLLKLTPGERLLIVEAFETPAVEIRNLVIQEARSRLNVPQKI